MIATLQGKNDGCVIVFDYKFTGKIIPIILSKLGSESTKIEIID